MSLLEALPSLLEAQRHADIDIATFRHRPEEARVRGPPLACHGALLAAISPNFWGQMGQELSGGGDEQPLVIMAETKEEEDEDDEDLLEVVLRLLYAGEVHVVGREGQEEKVLRWLRWLIPENEMQLQEAEETEEGIKRLNLSIKAGKRKRSPQRKRIRAGKSNLLTDPVLDFGPVAASSLIIKAVPRVLKRSFSESAEKENDAPPPEKKPIGHECPTCAKSFRYEKDLRKHQLVHSGKLPFGCAKCTRYFRNKSNLYKHLREKHKVERSEVQRFVIDEEGQLEVDERKKKAAKVDVEALLKEVARGAKESGLVRLKCPVCTKSFSRKTLRAHLNTHAEVRPFPCERCDSAFFSSTGLLKHCEKVHDSKDPEDVAQEEEETEPERKKSRRTYRCSFCPLIFPEEIARTHHTNEEHLDAFRFSCSVCHKTFALRTTLLVHQRTIHKMRVGREKVLQCKICQMVFSGKVELDKHKLAEHRDITEQLCPTCGKSFVTSEQLYRHEATHSERVRKLACAHCPKTFFRKDVLEQHERGHTQPVSCPECGKNFAHQRTLEAHQKSVHSVEEQDQVLTALSEGIIRVEGHHFSLVEDTVFACESCAETFVSEPSLEHHLNAVHPVTKHVRGTSFKCGHCGEESAKSLYGLKRHLVKHSCPLVREAGHCPACLQDPHTASRLKKHVLLNHAKRIVSCPSCPKLFRTQQELGNHLRTHAGSKPFSCHLCSDSFSQMSTLQQHLLRHDKGLVVDSFPCKTCGKVLKTNTAWKAHRRTHGDYDGQFGSPQLVASSVVGHPQISEAVAVLPSTSSSQEILAMVPEGLEEGQVPPSEDPCVIVDLKDLEAGLGNTYKIITDGSGFLQLQ